MLTAGAAARLATLAAAGVLMGTLISCASMPPPIGSYGIHALADRGVIERGHYLVYGPAHCAACHGDPAREEEMRRGHDIPLSGGRRFDLGAMGTVVAPNITSDPEAGIGSLSDDMLVRSLRYGISRHGRPLVPFMSFANLTDDDLRAILSFLRTVPPVADPAPPSELSWLGRFGLRYVLEPPGPSMPPGSSLEPRRTADYGRYLARAVANCHGCHTLRSKLTGAFVGPAFAGGMQMEEAGHTYLVPNLTPVETGVMRTLTEQEFIRRFRLRACHPNPSPMPWAAFARMTDSDLGAIYRYLRTLPPSQTPAG